ncbi:MAG: transporter substrate-binding domain-containing protein [Desulfohalobiaceae bacterium]|nr:transporter substrate-binding domain-containing protein [Desulfohalobiaceae bacterium]
MLPLTGPENAISGTLLQKNSEGSAGITADADPLQRAGSLHLTPEEREFLQNHPVIRVGNEDDWPPFDFSEQGKPRGYAIEHLELLGKMLGISFEYVNGYTWSELLELFKNGKIDVLPSLWISETRKQYMLFSEAFLELPYVIVTPRNDSGIDSFQDLQDKTISVPRGFKQEEVLREHYPGIGLHLVKNALEGLKAVSYGRADAYLGYRGVVDHLIGANFLSDLKIVGEAGVPELGPQGLYIAVRQELPLLQSILQKAMQSVDEKEKVALAQKWISVDRTGFPQLTREERLFLEGNPVLRVDNLQDWPPFNFQENGVPKGFCIDYMNLIGKKLSVRIEHASEPTWPDFLGMLQSGEIDVLCDVVKTRKREEFIDFTRPYFEIFSGIVVKKGRESFGSIEDLAGKKVAVPDKFYYHEILEEHYPDIRVVLKNSILDCLKAVSSEEVDAALSEKPVFDYLIQKHFLMDLRSIPIMEDTHFANTPVSFGVRNGNTRLQKILQKAMDVVSEEEITRLRQRWLNPEDLRTQQDRIYLSTGERNRLQDYQRIKVCVNDDWMPFEGIDDQKRHDGIAAEVLAVISERIGTPLSVVPSKGWNESRRFIENGKCDLLSCVQKTPEKSRYLQFSKPYIESVNVMVTRSQEPYISSLDSLAGKQLGIDRDNPVSGYIQNSYPNLRVVAVDNIDQGLSLVSKGKLDAVLGRLHEVSYKILDLGLYDLKIAGQSPYKEFLRIGIRKDAPEMAGAINKALDSLSQEGLNHITRKWLSIKYEHGFNYDLFWKLLAGGLIVLVAVLYWNRKLSLLNREIAEAHAELEAKSRELELTSITDPLTGIYNRLKLEEVLGQECRRASRYMHLVCVIMLDVDRFKSINDNYGHQAGDRVLTEIAAIIVQNTRESDTVGRWGGEEFLIICPDIDLNGACSLAEKLRKILENHRFSSIGRCTASFGVAQYRQGQRSVDVTSRADQAMYAAKAKGRNRVEKEPEEQNPGKTQDKPSIVLPDLHE